MLSHPILSYSILSYLIYPSLLNSSVLQSLGVLYDPTLLPPVDAASITRSDIDDALRPVRKEYGRAKLNNSVPRAVLYLTDFQGKTVARCLLSSVVCSFNLGLA